MGERATRTARGTAAGQLAGFRYHGLRHCLASLLIAESANVKTVQTRLRHTSAKTTPGTHGLLWPEWDGPTRAAIEAVFRPARPDHGPGKCANNVAAGQPQRDGYASK